MNEFFISCQESKIENNKSFYGSFCLGPFEESQSLTIANSLRRVLLSEINGLGIVSVQIEGASHEYSNLVGIQDSVLDILLNLKEVIFKKNTNNFKPQVAYLKMRGPGIVRAGHFNLSPSIQWVDPEQYIATLAENGFLNMKIIINYGNKWINASKPFSNDLAELKNKDIYEKESFLFNKVKAKYKNITDFNFEKRKLIIKKLIQMGMISGKFSAQNLSAIVQNLVAKTKNFQKTRLLTLARFTKNTRYPGVSLKKIYFTKNRKLKLFKNNLFSNQKLRSNTPVASSLNSGVKKKVKNYFGLNSLTKNYFISNSLTIDSIFNPINKVNYIVEVNDFKTTLDLLDTSSESYDLYNMVKSVKQNLKDFGASNLDPFLNKNDELGFFQSLAFQGKTQGQENLEVGIESPSGSPAGGFSNPEKTFSETEKEGLQKNRGNLPSKSRDEVIHENHKSFLNNKENSFKEDLVNILEIKKDLSSLKKKTIKHNIILEIWTNGSIHPRDALYQSFKNLIKTFSQLHKIKLDLKNFQENLGIQNSSQEFQKNRYLLKQIKSNQINYITDQKLVPLNEKLFLEAYLAPNMKDFYSKSPINPKYIKNPILKSKLERNILIKENLDSSEKKNTLFETKYSFMLIPIGPVNEVIGQLDIGTLNISFETYTLLKRANIKTIKDLIQFYNFKQNNSVREAEGMTKESIKYGVKSPLKITDFSLQVIKEIKRSLEEISTETK